ncbi:Ig-like domain-containing protein, partial [Pseudomonas sp. 18058]|uniref:Ig-like domain-containing protein n=1 Tax=Pseudomonas sp. 18058 TaxID=2681406 RepID=UPI0015B4BB31
EEAGDTDYAGLAVTFLVTDIVGNQSEDWCTETRITVSVGTVSLTAPIAKDAFNNKIDLDQLGNKDLTIQVWASPPSFKFGDIIHLKMRGTSVDGETIEVDAPTQTIDNLPHTYELLLNNADARRLVKTQVIFSYTLARSGSTEPLRSKNQFVQIEGEADRLAAPIAEDAQQGAINPDLPAPRIRIPYDPLIQVGMAIELSWVGTRPDGSTYDPELEWYFPSKSEVDNPQGFTISVEGTHLKTLEGGKLELSYALLSEKDNGDILRRESHKAAQLNVGEPSLELVAPLVLGEKDGSLEPHDLPNGTSQLTAPKSAVNPTKRDDVVTYTWVGDVSGRTEDSITLNSLSAGKDVPFHLDAEFVAKHIEPNRGKKVTASYWIWRAETGTTSYSNALEFTVGLELAVPEIISMTDSNGEPIPQNGLTVDPNAKVSGTASPNGTVLIYNNGVSTGGNATADAQGYWSRELRGLALGECSLTAVAQYGSDPESAPWKVSVTRLNAPSVKEADANNLNPVATKDGLTITIPSYVGINPSDKISVVWVGTAGGGSYTSPEDEFGTVDEREIQFRKEVVAFNLGLSVILKYTIRRGSAQPIQSQPFQMNVQTIPASELLNSIPTIDGALENELNILQLKDDAKTRIARWPLIATTQKMWLHYNGTNADGTPFSLQYYAATSVPFDGLPNGMLPPTPVIALRKLKVGSTLSVEFKISFDGSTDENKATSLPTRIYTVQSLGIGNDRSLQLTRYIVASDRPPKSPPAEATYSQPAIGGVPPYVYRSNAEQVATVTNQGVVTAKTNGNATITVTDSLGKTALYTLSVSGIKVMLKNDAKGRSWQDANAHCKSLGGRLATLTEMLAFYDLYSSENKDVALLLNWPIIRKGTYPWWGAWTSTERGDDSYFVNLDAAPSLEGFTGWHAKTALRPVICIINL